MGNRNHNATGGNRGKGQRGQKRNFKSSKTSVPRVPVPPQPVADLARQLQAGQLVRCASCLGWFRQEALPVPIFEISDPITGQIGAGAICLPCVKKAGQSVRAFAAQVRRVEDYVLGGGQR